VQVNILGRQKKKSYKDSLSSTRQRMNLLYVEIKSQLAETDEFFIADLTACSACFGHHYAHHQEL
jgi:hypothetical protein